MAETIENHLKADQAISDIVGVFTDPVIVMPGGWGDTLPGWIKEAITLERLIENIKRFQDKETPTGSDAEAVAYLYTASLELPMDSDWSQIYLYVAGKVIAQHKKTEMPADIKVNSLNDYQKNRLNGLKRWIYETRVRARQGKERSERRQQKEEQKQEQLILQPKMFEF